MNKYVKLVGFGFLIWLIPFLGSFVIFPLRNANRPLFESTMPVILVLTVLIISVLYFKKIEKESLKEGVIAGVLWFALSLVIDLMLFLPASTMQMSFSDYMMDIGLTYLIILMIPIGIGALVSKK
jgi:hypothetical protein